LRTKQIDLSNDENALSDMCQGQEYETILKEVNEKVEELQVSSLFVYHNTVFVFLSLLYVIA